MPIFDHSYTAYPSTSLPIGISSCSDWVDPFVVTNVSTVPKSHFNRVDHLKA